MKIKSHQKTKANLKVRVALVGLSVIVAFLSFFILINSLTSTNKTKAASGGMETETRRELILHKETLEQDEKFQNARPLISPDGKTLYFGRRNHPDNVGGILDFQDIWVANIDSLGTIKKINSIGENINNSKGNGICSISEDGKTILLTNEYSKAKEAPICISKKKNGVWSKPEPVFIQGYYNKSQFEDFYLSFEHDVLFMATERKEGMGDQDIYVSLPDGSGNWKTPINLGLNINTNTAEFAPFLGSDGKSLFFASYRPGGLGESDIYVSTRLDSTWTNWSTPVNLGPTVNTPNEESYFSIASNFSSIYIESYGKENSNRNIYQIPLPREFKPGAGNFLVISY